MHKFKLIAMNRIKEDELIERWHKIDPEAKTSNKNLTMEQVLKQGKSKFNVD